MSNPDPVEPGEDIIYWRDVIARIAYLESLTGDDWFDNEIELSGELYSLQRLRNSVTGQFHKPDDGMSLLRESYARRPLLGGRLI